jgi:hypothetical protein
VVCYLSFHQITRHISIFFVSVTCLTQYDMMLLTLVVLLENCLLQSQMNIISSSSQKESLAVCCSTG